MKKSPVFWNTFESMIAEGNGLRKVGNAMGIPHVTLLRWIDETPGMRDLYDRAREARAESLADYAQETVEAVRTGEIEAHAGRVVLDFAKWRTKADNPGIYSEKIDSRVTADVNIKRGHLEALRDIIDVTPKPLTESSDGTSDGTSERGRGSLSISLGSRAICGGVYNSHMGQPDGIGHMSHVRKLILSHI